MSLQQKVVLKVLTMTDDKTKQKAIQAAAHIHGVESIGAEEKEGKLTVIGNMDAVALLKRVKKKVGKVDILWVGPAAAAAAAPAAIIMEEDKDNKKNDQMNDVEMKKTKKKKKKKAGEENKLK